MQATRGRFDSDAVHDGSETGGPPALMRLSAVVRVHPLSRTVVRAVRTRSSKPERRVRLSHRALQQKAPWRAGDDLRLPVWGGRPHHLAPRGRARASEALPATRLPRKRESEVRFLAEALGMSRSSSRPRTPPSQGGNAGSNPARDATMSPPAEPALTLRTSVGEVRLLSGTQRRVKRAGPAAASKAERTTVWRSIRPPSSTADSPSGKAPSCNLGKRRFDSGIGLRLIRAPSLDSEGPDS